MSWGKVTLVDILFFKENIIIFSCILLLESPVQKKKWPLAWVGEMQR